MKPIRILHFAGSLHMAGLETWLMNIYRAIDRSLIQFDFVVHTNKRYFYEDEIERLGGKVYHFTVREDLKLWKYVKDLKRFFQEHKEYKIIEGHQQTFGVIYLGVAKKCGVPIRIAHSHMASFNKTLKGYLGLPLSKMFKVNATHCVSVSEKAAKFMFGNHPFELAPNGILTDNFKFDEQKRLEIRKELDIGDRFVVGHVGRFQTQKNHAFLIEVFYEIKKMRDDAVLVLIGVGELQDDIRKRVEQLGLTDCVKFLGVRNDVNCLLQGMDLFIFPSFFEGLPGVLVEAQTAGLPILCSDAITQETKMTPTYHSYSLSDSAQQWAEYGLKIEAGDRSKMVDYVVANGYDSNDVARNLQDRYIELYKSVAESES